jgi:hypothetical protein
MITQVWNYSVSVADGIAANRDDWFVEPVVEFELMGEFEPSTRGKKDRSG